MGSNLVSAAAKAARLDYTAERTGVYFHNSDAFVRGVRGPRGMGKSVMSIWEIIRRANAQRPFNGVRRSRWAAVRNTYPELKSSTLATWTAWFPEDCFPIKHDHPITATLRYPLADPETGKPDGTTVELEVLFLALDTPKDVSKLLSTEFTGIWLNEARELPRAVVDMATASVGRYPAKVAGGSNWMGVIMDTNPPDTDHWWYQLFEVERPVGWEQFVQPPALLGTNIANLQPNNGQDPRYPKAENIQNLEGGHDYWMRMSQGKRWEWIKVYVMNEYGTVSDGKPVYPEYNDEYHCSKKPLTLYRGAPLLVGLDFGLTPSCALVQVSPRGQVRVIDEICGTSIGIKRFVRENFRPRLISDYANIPVTIWGDPAGNQRAQTDERTVYEILREEGYTAHPAIENGFRIRREAVSKYLMMNIDGEPGLIIDPKCVTMRKGFLGKYCLERKQMTGKEEFKDEPADNPYTHIQDGLQYVCMMIGQSSQQTAGQTQYKSRPVVVKNPRAWT